MTLFLLSIGCVVHEFKDTIDSICHPSLSIHWWFQGLQLLCFHRRFMDQSWHSVVYNSMRQPWLYFCYWFDASVVNSLTLLITIVGCHSIFIDDFKVYSCSIFAGDLWISRDIAFLTIPCGSHELIGCVVCEFSDVVDSIRLLSLSIHWQFKFYRDFVFTNDLWISNDIAFLTIPCVSHDSIFAIDLIRRSWIHWHCRFHTSPVTQYSLMISRFTETLFSLTIYGSAMT